MAVNGELKNININEIEENIVALRDVDKAKEDYIGLVDSIRRVGIMNPISVREVKNPETGKMFYAIIDGLHRWTAAKDAGLTMLPCYVKPLAEAEILEAQIIANVQKIETRPFEYKNQIKRLFLQNPLLTKSELAARIGKSPD